MNPTRWAFLADGIERVESEMLEAMQLSLARALGIHAVPIRDGDGALRLPERFEEMFPFMLGIMRPDFVAKQVEQYQRQLRGDEPELDPDAVPAVDLDDLDDLDFAEDAPVDSGGDMDAFEIVEPQRRPTSDDEADAEGSSFILED